MDAMLLDIVFVFETLMGLAFGMTLSSVIVYSALSRISSLFTST